MDTEDLAVIVLLKGIHERLGWVLVWLFIIAANSCNHV